MTELCLMLSLLQYQQQHRIKTSDAVFLVNRELLPTSLHIFNYRIQVYHDPNREFSISSNSDYNWHLHQHPAIQMIPIIKILIITAHASKTYYQHSLCHSSHCDMLKTKQTDLLTYAESKQFISTT